MGVCPVAGVPARAHVYGFMKRETVTTGFHARSVSDYRDDEIHEGMCVVWGCLFSRLSNRGR